MAYTKLQTRLQQNRPLSDLTTIGIGGPARYLLEVTHPDELCEAIHYANTLSMPYLILGKGSNTLFDDLGYNGLVILNRIDVCQLHEGTITVGAGHSFAHLGVWSAKQHLAGLEFAAGIPGSVGGAIYMNAGACGAQTADCLINVTFVDGSGELRTLPKEQLRFAYRTSWFQAHPAAIASATFQLTPSDQARSRQLQYVNQRLKTQPYRDKSAGCLFRNPPGRSAGHLIEQCGLKGLRQGGAQVSEMHANFLLNRGNATASDVLALAEHIRATVLQRCEVQLKLEVCVVCPPSR